MSELLRKSRTFLRMSWSMRLLVLEAMFWLGLARASILLFPFKRLTPIIGPVQTESPSVDDATRTRSVQGIAWAINTASHHTPWVSNCLPQAVAGKIMLGYRRIPSTLYLGLRKTGSDMEAHAWLRAGTVTVTGGASSDETFTVISSFGTHHAGGINRADGTNKAGNSR